MRPFEVHACGGTHAHSRTTINQSVGVVQMMAEAVYGWDGLAAATTTVEGE